MTTLATALNAATTAEEVLAIVGPVLAAAVPVTAPAVTLAGAELAALQGLLTWLATHQGPSPAQSAWDAAQAALDAQDKGTP